MAALPDGLNEGLRAVGLGSPLPALALQAEPGLLALDEARARACIEQLPYAGSLPPVQAWALVHSGRATLVDVRTTEERTFVGQVPQSLHVAWATGTGLNRNPRFVRELEAKASKHDVVLLCRSGKRSALAAEAAAKAGFQHVFNVLEGFEGEQDEPQHRGHHCGWRFHPLPWVQA